MTEEALPPVEEVPVDVPVEEPVEEPVDEPTPVIPPKSEFVEATRIEFEVWIPEDVYRADRYGFEAIAMQRFESHWGIPAAGVTALTRQSAQPGFHTTENFTVLTVYSFVHSFRVKEAGDDAL